MKIMQLRSNNESNTRLDILNEPAPIKIKRQSLTKLQMSGLAPDNKQTINTQVSQGESIPAKMMPPSDPERTSKKLSEGA